MESDVRFSAVQSQTFWQVSFHYRIGSQCLMKVMTQSFQWVGRTTHRTPHSAFAVAIDMVDYSMLASHPMQESSVRIRIYLCPYPCRRLKISELQDLPITGPCTHAIGSWAPSGLVPVDSSQKNPYFVPLRLSSIERFCVALSHIASVFDIDEVRSIQTHILAWQKNRLKNEQKNSIRYLLIPAMTRVDRCIAEVETNCNIEILMHTHCSRKEKWNSVQMSL